MERYFQVLDEHWRADDGSGVWEPGVWRSFVPPNPEVRPLDLERSGLWSSEWGNAGLLATLTLIEAEWRQLHEPSGRPRGFRVLELAELPERLGARIWQVELDGEIVRGRHGLIARRVRLDRPLAAWDEVRAREFAIGCATSALATWERELPADRSAHRALEAASAHLAGRLDETGLAAAADELRSRLGRLVAERSIPPRLRTRLVIAGSAALASARSSPLAAARGAARASADLAAASAPRLGPRTIPSPALLARARERARQGDELARLLGVAP